MLQRINSMKQLFHGGLLPLHGGRLRVSRTRQP
jgi:hypothetical protein